VIGHFKRSTKRLFALILSIPLVILVGGVLYMFGMTYVEGAPRDFWTSLEWAAETLTTVGYGSESHWTHPAMTVFVIFFELVGMSFYVLIFPVFFLPYFEEHFEQRLPGSLPEMAGRVLIHRYGPAVDSLVEELRHVGTAFVILEQDERQARRLRERGYEVVFGALDEQPGMLAGVEKAQALITNSDDHADATFIMMARERGYTGPILALAEEPLHRPAMEKDRCHRGVHAFARAGCRAGGARQRAYQSQGGRIGTARRKGRHRRLPSPGRQSFGGATPRHTAHARALRSNRDRPVERWPLRPCRRPGDTY
jgi:hypothetical protein